MSCIKKSRFSSCLHYDFRAPFTVQRLCELICFPHKHYKRIDKYMRALEKIVLVVTTVDEYGRSVNIAAASAAATLYHISLHLVAF